MPELAHAELVALLERSPDLARLALAAALGIPEPDSSSFFLDNDIELNWSQILDALDQKITRYHAQIRARGERYFRLAPHARLTLFDADCMVFPAAFNMKRARLKLPRSALNYAFFLPKAEVDAFLPGIHFDRDHVYNAFGYVRFYVMDQRILVTEIQGDMYGALKSNRLRRRYNDWYKLLLLGFEFYVAQCFGGNTPILIAGMEYQLRRNPGIRPSLAERLYLQLPLSFHYVATDIHAALEPVHNPIEVLSGWKKTPFEHHSDGLQQFFGIHHQCSFANRLTVTFNKLISAGRD